MESEIVVSASPRGDSIRDTRVLRAFPRLREHLGRLRPAYHILRLLREGTPERLPDPRLYDAALAVLRSLDRPDVQVTPLFVLSMNLHFLRHLGALPDTMTCARCRRPLCAGAFGFDTRALAFFCSTCAPAREASPELTNAVKLFRMLLRNPVPSPKVKVSQETVSTLALIIQVLLRPVHTQTGLRVPSRATL